MAVLGAKKVTPDFANYIWDEIEKGLKTVRIAANVGCCQNTVNRLNQIRKAAKENPDTLDSLFPGAYKEVKKAAINRFTPQHSNRKDNTDNSEQIVKLLAEICNNLTRLCEALDIK